MSPGGAGVAGRHPDSGRGRPHCDPSLGAQSSNPGPGLGPALTPEPQSEPSVTHPHPQPPVPNPTGSRGICEQQLPLEPATRGGGGGGGRGGCGGAAGGCSGGWGPQAPANLPPTLSCRTRRTHPAYTALGRKRSPPPSGLSQPASRAVRLQAALPAPLTCTRSPGAGQRVPGGSHTPPRPPCRPPPPARARAGPGGRHTARR